MNELTIAERQNLAAILELAIREDLGQAGDVTSAACIPADARGQAAFVARRDGVLAGMTALGRILERFDPRIELAIMHHDGTRVSAGWWLATVSGPLQSILAAERTALNFLQRLSGIATLTRQFVDAVSGTRARILETRKTLPGWRLLDKYAVRAGGGTNHRIGLYDGVLIKDNHLAGLRRAEPNTADVIAEAVRRCRATQPHLPVEVEVDSLEQLELALACRPDIVLLDNFSVEQMWTAVARRGAVGPGVLLEASGGVALDRVRDIAETGVDRISVGALTHSAPALDIALDYVD